METEEKYLTEKQIIYETAIATFGSEKQIIMLFEEMSELQKELCKHFRGKIEYLQEARKSKKEPGNVLDY